MEKTPVLWDIHKTAQTLGITTRAVEMKCYRGQLPFIKLGKRRMFDSEEILAIIEQGRHPAFATKEER